MPIKLGMVMDSIDHINIKKDTSFAMLLERRPEVGSCITWNLMTCIYEWQSLCQNQNANC